jgi:uncharacterized spore protein YtfJ
MNMDDKPTVALEPIEDLLARLNVSAAFGEPVREGDTTLIPVASVAAGFGYGSGYGRAPGKTPGQAKEKPAEQDSPEATTPDEGEGGGAGAGGGGWVKPQGYIRIRGDEVRYEPIMSMTLIPLAGMLTGAWCLFWITAAVRAFARK